MYIVIMVKLINSITSFKRKMERLYINEFSWSNSVIEELNDINMECKRS